MEEEQERIDDWRKKIESGAKYYVTQKEYIFTPDYDCATLIANYSLEVRRANYEGLVLMSFLIPDYANLNHISLFLTTLAWKKIPVAARFANKHIQEKLENLVPYVLT